MLSSVRMSMLVAAALVACSGVANAQQGPQAPNMTFFVTSAGPGHGANLGGIEGADAHCQKLAGTVGAGGKTWHAYLSSNTNAADPSKTVNARDRIGKGPWQNFKGEVIANNVDELHNAATNKLSATTGLTERGQRIPTFGFAPNHHDMMTGSQPDGRAFPGNMNLTCNNYASDQFGKVEVGHVDRTGLTDTDQAHSWNSSHQSRDCSQEGLISTGGNGLFYCFAVQ